MSAGDGAEDRGAVGAGDAGDVGVEGAGEFGVEGLGTGTPATSVRTVYPVSSRTSSFRLEPSAGTVISAVNP